MGAITSNTFTLRSGTGSLSISQASLTGGQNMDVVEIGTIKGDFDLEEDENESTSILFNLGEFSFTAFDKLSDGTSLFAALDGLSATDLVQLDISFTTDGGHAINDRYYFTIEEMEYDRNRRTTSINTAKQDAGDLQKDMVEFFNSDVAAGDIVPFTGTTTDTDSINTKDFIETALPLFNSSNTTINESNLYSTTVSGGTTVMIVVKTDAADVDETLFELAASEGSIVGTMMGYNFFVTRQFSAGSTVSLNQSDIEDDTLKIKPGLDSYVGIDVTFEGSSINWSNFSSYSRLTTLAEDVNISETIIDVDSIAGISAGDFVLVNEEIMYVESTSTGQMTVKRGYRSDVTTHSNGDHVVEVYNPDAAKRLDVKFLNPVLAWAQYDSVNDEFDNVGGEISSPTREGQDGYASGYGANKARKVEFTILDIDKLDPFEAIQFDSSFPSIIQGDTFRPSELEYDLQEDKIMVKAYKIS